MAERRFKITEEEHVALIEASIERGRVVRTTMGRPVFLVVEVSDVPGVPGPDRWQLELLAHLRGVS